jgi:hypothetical protein
MDGDGFLSRSDLEACYSMKLEGGAAEDMGGISPFDALCQVYDIIAPTVPDRVRNQLLHALGVPGWELLSPAARSPGSANPAPQITTLPIVCGPLTTSMKSQPLHASRARG